MKCRFLLQKISRRYGKGRVISDFFAHTGRKTLHFRRNGQTCPFNSREHRVIHILVRTHVNATRDNSFRIQYIYEIGKSETEIVTDFRIYFFGCPTATLRCFKQGLGR